MEEEEKSLEEDIIAIKDVPIFDMTYFKQTFCDFKWKIYMTEQITKIIKILEEHNDDTHKLTREEIGKLFFIFGSHNFNIKSKKLFNNFSNCKR